MEINDAQDPSSSASVLVCFLYVDNGKLVTRLYDKRNDFNVSIVSSPILTSNIRSAPVCGVNVSQLVCYARAGSNYQDFVDRREKLVDFYGRHHELADPSNVAVSEHINDLIAAARA